MSSTAESKPAYPIGAVRHANTRLDLQFYQIQSFFQNQLLDPHIPHQQAPSLKIADVCCGTGIWLLSLLRSGLLHPSTELHALDINLANLPPKPWIPKITQHVYNVFDEPPIELHGVFDIVNVSLTLTFVVNDQVDGVLSNIMKLIKPGGWLQWTEMDLENGEVFSPDGEIPQDATARVLRVYPSAWELYGRPFPTWISKLDKHFAAADNPKLQNITTIKPPIDFSALRAWTAQFFTMGGRDEVPDSMSIRLPDTPENRERVQKFRDIVEDGYQDVLTYRAGTWIPLIRVIGQRSRSPASPNESEPVGPVFTFSSAL